MPKTIQINIDEPCHENWQQMTSHEQGRFCGSCQKMVVDFTAMTDKEILEYISQASHTICGRVNNDQMNRDIRVTENKRRFSFAYVWNLALAAFLFTKADAQTGKMVVKKQHITKAPKMVGEIVLVEPPAYTPPVQAKGVVIDARDGTPLAGASVTIKDKQTGMATDSAGRFELPVKLEGTVELLVSSVGYETQTVVVEPSTNWQNLKVSLSPLAQELEGVTVIGFPTQGQMRITYMGAISGVRIDTFTEKVKRTLNEWIIKKNDVKVFPNPTLRGNAMNVGLTLKEPGQYRLELLDASGKILHAQLVQMPTTTRTVQVPTHATWSAGVYWLRISGQHVKNVYQNKVIIQ